MERQLRVSVCAQGRIVDDRFIPTRELLSKSLLPKELRLFGARDGRPVLRAPAGARGQLALDGRTPTALPMTEVALGPDARGWVEVSGAKLFFQMLPRPEPVPREVLTRAVRVGLFATMEKSFLAALCAVLAVEAVGVWRVHAHPMPVLEQIDGEAFGGFHPMELPTLPKPVPRPKPTARAPHAPARPGGHAPTREAPTDAGKGLIALLGAQLRQAGMTVFHQPLPTIDIHGPPPQPTGEPQSPTHRGIGDVDQVAQQELDGPTHREVGLHEHGGGAAPPIVVIDEPPPVPGRPDLAGKILAEVKRLQGGVQHCYERALKLEPGLRGRITLDFSVEPDGRVADVDVLDETLGSSDTDACVATLVRTWRLGVRPGEATPVEFPFVLSPAN